ncbi:MAG: hypothetical protein HFJ35_06895 [Clostridia bacterium]|nr:hypothetical protein [Clostridia bacterium]
MAFIIIVTIAIYLILMAWTWQSLGFLEKPKKVAFIIIGMILMYLITLIIFQMAKEGIVYENEPIRKSIQNILVAIFTGINGMIVMPQIGKILDKMNEDELEQIQWKKRIILLIIVVILCVIFEVGYMKDTQKGILNIYHSMIQK